MNNWDWYEDSIAGLDEYAEYLESFPNLDDVLVWDVFAWKLAEAARLAAVPVVPVVEEVEVARQALVATVIKNDKLDVFLDRIVEG